MGHIATVKPINPYGSYQIKAETIGPSMAVAQKINAAMEKVIIIRHGFNNGHDYIFFWVIFLPIPIPLDTVGIFMKLIYTYAAISYFSCTICNILLASW